MNWFQNILFLTTVKWIMVSVSLNSFQILILDDQSKVRDFVHFFDMHVISENIHSFCFFQKITNDGSIIHVRFYISLPLIYSNTGEMVLPFLEGIKYMYLVHNHFHLNIPHLPIQYYLSSVSIRCRQSHTNVV